MTHLHEEPDASVPPEEMAKEDSEGEDDKVKGESLEVDSPSDAQLELVAKEHESSVLTLSHVS